MKTNLSRLTAIASAVVGLALAMPALAADKMMKDDGMARSEYKSSMASCKTMQGSERSMCEKDAKAKRRAMSSSRMQDGKGPSSTNETAGSMQKSPTGMDREKSTMTSAPAKGSSEIAGDRQGAGASTIPRGNRVDMSTDKRGSSTPAPAKGSSEIAGDRQGAGASTVPR